MLSELNSIVALQFNLIVEDGWPPVPVEVLSCRIMNVGYEVLDSPFYIRDLSIGDVITIDDGDLEGVNKWHHLTKSDHTTIWIARLRIPNCIDEVLAELRSIGCSTAALPSLGSYVVDVPDTISLDTVDRILTALDGEKAAVAFPSLRHPE